MAACRPLIDPVKVTAAARATARLSWTMASRTFVDIAIIVMAIMDLGND
jgi:hypothetical protein